MRPVQPLRTAQCVDHMTPEAQHAAFEYGEKPDRTCPDDRDIGRDGLRSGDTLNL